MVHGDASATTLSPRTQCTARTWPPHTGFIHYCPPLLYPQLTILINSFIGLAITAVYKYADAVMKTLASCFAAAALVYLSAAFFSAPLTLTTVAGSTIVFLSTYVYFAHALTSAPAPAPTPAPAAASNQQQSGLALSDSDNEGTDGAVAPKEDAVLVANAAPQKPATVGVGCAPGILLRSVKLFGAVGAVLLVVALF